MTQDKSNITNPTLTEDFVHDMIHEMIDGGDCTTKPFFKQILTALDQYPKLKEQLYATQERMIKAKDDAWDTWKVEYEKLKAENEELKKKYGGQISAVEQLIIDHERIVQSLQNTKTLVIDPNPELQQENNQLKQLKERIEDKIKNLNINLQFCSTQGLTWEIIKSNIRVCESILKGDSTN